MLDLDDILASLERVNDDGEAERYDPEEAGLLVHEYFDEVYDKFPKYEKNRISIDHAFLNKRDPLKERHDPYNDESNSRNNFNKGRNIPNQIWISGSSHTEQY